MSRRRRKKSWISWLIILILLIAAGVVCYLVWEGYFKEKETINSGDDAKVQTDVRDNEKDESESDETVKKEETVRYDGENPNNAAELTGVITYAGVSGEKLMIRVNIDQYLNGGECMLLLETAGNVVYSNVARVVDSAATATCEGFDISTDLLEAGQYNITVEVESDGKKGVIEGEVSV